MSIEAKAERLKDLADQLMLMSVFHVEQGDYEQGEKLRERAQTARTEAEDLQANIENSKGAQS